MKHLLTLILASFLAISIHAQNDGQRQEAKADGQKQEQRAKFDPEQYQRNLEAFITKEAGLCPEEARVFFPLLREMQQKQRAIYKKQKAFDKAAFYDNKVAESVIFASDERDLEIKKLQQQYHKQFVKVIPATKVLKAIHAEERFTRNAMRNFSRNRHDHNQNHNQNKNKQQ